MAINQYSYAATVGARVALNAIKDKAVIDRRLRPGVALGSYFMRPKSSHVSPQACMAAAGITTHIL